MSYFKGRKLGLRCLQLLRWLVVTLSRDECSKLCVLTHGVPANASPGDDNVQSHLK